MFKRLIVLPMAVVLILATATSGFADTILDEYIGSDDHGWGDVIGDESKFGISSMEVTLTGSILQVDIYTNFAGLGDDGLFSSYTNNGLGIGYGDLFLSSAWTPDGSSPYQNDDHANGTLWSYGFALDDNWGNGGSGILYDLNGGSNDANAILTDDLFNGATYRNGQEVLVDEDSNYTVALANSGSWYVDADNHILGFAIDISGTDLYTGSEIALHWGPTCANDIIEGSVPVPEPSTMLLLAIGLLVLPACRLGTNN